jgi:hypothetical protein
MRDLASHGPDHAKCRRGGTASRGSGVLLSRLPRACSLGGTKTTEQADHPDSKGPRTLGYDSQGGLGLSRESRSRWRGHRRADSSQLVLESGKNHIDPEIELDFRVPADEVGSSGKQVREIIKGEVGIDSTLVH